MHLYLGCFYLWGNIQVYVTSYLHKHNENITLDDTGIVFVVMLCAQAAFTPVSPLALRFFPPWACCIGGGVLAIGCVFLSTFTTSLPLFIFLYGFCFGLGIGASYMCPIIAGWEYFPTRKGLVSGLIVGGFGFGSFIFGFIALAIANPNNEKPDTKVAGGKIFGPENPISDNAPIMLRYLCLMWAVLLLIALPFLRRKSLPYLEEVPEKPENQRLVDGTDTDTEENGNSEDSLRRSTIILTKDPTIKQSLFSLKALHMWTMVVFSSSFPLYVASNFKSYGSIDIPDDQFMTIVGAVGAALNGVSRVGWASLVDMFGFKYVYMSLLTVEISIAFTFVLIHKIKVLYLVWVLISFT